MVGGGVNWDELGEGKECAQSVFSKVSQKKEKA